MVVTERIGTGARGYGIGTSYLATRGENSTDSLLAAGLILSPYSRSAVPFSS